MKKMNIYFSSILFVMHCVADTILENPEVHCPTSKKDWEARSMTFDCRDGTSYHCLFTENFVLKETCTRRKSIGPGRCPFISRYGDISDLSFPCSVNFPGCPNGTHGYHSDRLFIYKRCWINPQSVKDGEEDKRHKSIKKEEKEKVTFQNTTLMEEEKGDANFIRLKPLHLLIGAVGTIAILFVIIIICAVKCCCRRNKHQNPTVDHIGLLSTPLQSRSNLTLYDDIYGIRIAPSVPVLRTCPSRELLYDYPIPENRSLPLVNRNIPALAELPPSRFASREVLASQNNIYASMEPFYIEVEDSIGTGISGSSYLSLHPPRKYDSLDRFQRFRDMKNHRGYRAMQTGRTTFTIQQRRSSF